MYNAANSKLSGRCNVYCTCCFTCYLVFLYFSSTYSQCKGVGGAATVLCADDLGGNKTRNGRIMMSRNIIYRDDDDDDDD